MGRSDTILKFSITIDLEIFKTLFPRSFKKYVKNTYLAVILISHGVTS